MVRSRGSRQAGRTEPDRTSRRGAAHGGRRPASAAKGPQRVQDISARRVDTRGIARDGSSSAALGRRGGGAKHSQVLRTGPWAALPRRRPGLRFLRQLLLPTTQARAHAKIRQVRPLCRTHPKSGHVATVRPTPLATTGRHSPPPTGAAEVQQAAHNAKPTTGASHEHRRCRHRQCRDGYGDDDYGYDNECDGPYHSHGYWYDTCGDVLTCGLYAD
jgi:hypothetical protein